MSAGAETLRSPSPEELDLQRVKYESGLIEVELLKPDGILHKLAAVKVKGSLENDPRAIASVIVADPDATKERFTRADLLKKTEADKPSKEVIRANSDRIISLAEKLGMRKLVGGERQPEDVEAIDPQRAVFVVEGGANKSSIIRRGVAIEGMRAAYRRSNEQLEEVDLSDKTLYQFGAARRITPTKEKENDDGSKTTTDNPEYVTIRGLAGDYLPEHHSFTEFDANLATALADGYAIQSQGAIKAKDMLVTKIELKHEANPLLPKLVLIQPAAEGKFKDGLAALNSLKPLQDKQLVIATNGQYRPKDVDIAATYAKDNSINMLQPVSLGDEPGDVFQYNGRVIKTDSRGDTAYVNEFVIRWYLAQRRLHDTSGLSDTEQSQQLQPENDSEQIASVHRLVRVVQLVRDLFDVIGVRFLGESKTAEERSTTELQKSNEKLGRTLGAVAIVSILAAVIIFSNRDNKSR